MPLPVSYFIIMIIMIIHFLIHEITSLVIFILCQLQIFILHCLSLNSQILYFNYCIEDLTVEMSIMFFLSLDHKV